MQTKLTISGFRSAIALLLLAFFSVGIPLAAFGAEVRTGEQPSVAQGETIADNLYIAGGNVTNAGTITGDLLAAGGTVLVNGTVGGDVAAAGGTVTVLRDIADDFRAAGGTIVLQSAVRGDVTVAGGQLHLGGSIGGDLIAGGGTVRLDAPVGGDIRIGGGNVYLNSSVGGNVDVYAETLTLGPAARIAGTLKYAAATEASMEEGAVVSGEITFEKRKPSISVGGIVAVISFALVMTFLSQLASALLLALSFRRFAVRLVEDAAARPLLEVGRGLVAFIVLPAASLMLLYTLIGIPLGLLGLLISGTLFVYLWIMTPVLLGSLAYRSFFSGEFDVNWKTVLLGVFIYTLLGLVPIVGWIVQFLLMLLTLGVTVKLKWEAAKEWR